jgi:hypothetical protein
MEDDYYSVDAILAENQVSVKVAKVIRVLLREMPETSTHFQGRGA